MECECGVWSVSVSEESVVEGDEDESEILERSGNCRHVEQSEVEDREVGKSEMWFMRLIIATVGKTSTLEKQEEH